MQIYNLQQLSNTKNTWPINEYAYIGSDTNCGIRLDSAEVPDRVARVETKNNKLFIRSLKINQLVSVNDTQVVEAMLADGDIISINAFEFVVNDITAQKKNFELKSRCEFWNKQLQTLSSVADSKHPVLILGPSGSGKDIIAQHLHQASQVQKMPFISVNCSALTETLIESELFGHIKGSFTGAISDRKGAFESARGGTLFLDEIGDLPYGLQAKLLRALENNEIRPVGSDRTIKTNVRIVAATHQNLYQKIREGQFRSDLFYRLNVICVETPSLKERLEDFEDLIYQFAKHYRVRFSHNAIMALKKHDWPGNIRELKNVVARASALFPKQYIECDSVDMLINKKERVAHAGLGISYADEHQSAPLPVIKEIEKQMIIKRLVANRGNQKRTAHDLGLPKSTLHDRIKTYNISVDQFKA